VRLFHHRSRKTKEQWSEKTKKKRLFDNFPFLILEMKFIKARKFWTKIGGKYVAS
jgi:hypothetical protein